MVCAVAGGTEPEAMTSVMAGLVLLGSSLSQRLTGLPVPVERIVDMLYRALRSEICMVVAGPNRQVNGESCRCIPPYLG